MAPWMSPLMDNFKHHFKDRTYFEMMIEKGQIEIAPLSFIRGRTFSNSFIIVDEAQNATIHELKTIITRIGEGSKIVLMGDTDQIDTPYIDKKSNGLSIVIDRFHDSELMTHIHLNRGERSELATVASRLL
jgi:PhoH-like ATPase